MDAPPPRSDDRAALARLREALIESDYTHDGLLRVLRHSGLTPAPDEIPLRLVTSPSASAPSIPSGDSAFAAAARATGRSSRNSRTIAVIRSPDGSRRSVSRAHRAALRGAGFPGLERAAGRATRARRGSSKDPRFIELSFAPESALTSPSSGKLPGVSDKQKQWLASNFKLEIDGLDCTKVSKIDEFPVKQAPGNPEFPNLRVTLAATSGQTWADFFQSFVLDGNSGDDKEKNGTLTFLDNRSTELGKINFFHLGIFKLYDDTTSGIPGNAIKRMVAELYCERMELHIPPDSGGTT